MALKSPFYAEKCVISGEKECCAAENREFDAQALIADSGIWLAALHVVICENCRIKADFHVNVMLA